MQIQHPVCSVKVKALIGKKIECTPALFCMEDMAVKAACSCESRDEKAGVMFAAAAGSDLKPAPSAATEDHACSFARGA